MTGRHALSEQKARLQRLKSNTSFVASIKKLLKYQQALLSKIPIYNDNPGIADRIAQVQIALLL